MWQEFYGRYGDEVPPFMRKKADESRVDMDASLSEAFFAFYWLSEERTYNVGMAGATPNFIPITSIRSYYSAFRPALPERHFITVIRAADRQYCELQAEKQKKNNKLKQQNKR